MAKHTPGPWVADECGMDDDRELRVSYHDGTETYYQHSPTICQCFASEPDDDDKPRISPDQAEANARLIAAAPDFEEASAYFVMLSIRLGSTLPADVKKWAQDILKDKKRTGLEVINAAIAKSTGRKPS